LDKAAYDPLGQVRSGRKYWSDQTPVAGQQFEYAHDDIGNRTSTKAGGDQNGANLRSATYGANSLNQYTNRQVPGAVDVMGLSLATNTVTVNGQTAYRKGEYFREQLPANNANGPLWTNITVAASGQTSVSGNEFVPKTPEQFSYDADGNLTNDGRWQYTWDAENRLVSLATNTMVGPRQSIKFEYDWRGRRIHKQVWSNTGWSGTPTNDVKFVYDGWNLLAELNGTNNAVIRSYVWGSDLSGTMQGAGGVSGLLKVAYNGAQTTNCFVAFDGNGNVAALADAASTNILTQYEYGPFGELLRATGPMAKVNPFRFSTEYQDDESDIVMYQYRPYSPSAGRFLSRDPVEEPGASVLNELDGTVSGGVIAIANLYVCAGNHTVNSVDVFGLWNTDVHRDMTTQWANGLGISSGTASAIGIADDAIDTIFPPDNLPLTNTKFSWHFNRSTTGGDSRLEHRDKVVKTAQTFCTGDMDDPVNAARFLGYALHPTQDWVAHGDFDRWQEAPSLTLSWYDSTDYLYYVHNWLHGRKKPDNPKLDSDGPDGRATIGVMRLTTTLSNGDRTYWANFHTGSLRITKTKQLTEEVLSAFQSYVRANAKACGRCRQAFLPSN
jgi:RHS repeat-associated protein